MSTDKITITGGKFKGNNATIVGMLSSIGDITDYKVLIDGEQDYIVINSKHFKKEDK